MVLEFTGERIVPGASNCEPLFADKMYMEHSARYKLACHFAKGAKVLDIGCGVGYGSALLVDAGAASVTAFDLSAEAIEHAKQHYARSIINFGTGDATNFAFNEKFDLIVCFELIEHVPYPDKTFACIMSAIKDDGILVMSTPRALEQKRNDFHIHEYTPSEFRQKLQSLFRNIRFFQQNNYMGSIIASHQPETLANPGFMNPRFNIDMADYIIGVATNGPSEKIADIDTITVLNNEDYVKLLERDVDILQKRRIELDAQVTDAADQMQVMLSEKECVKTGLASFKLNWSRIRHYHSPHLSEDYGLRSIRKFPDRCMKLIEPQGACFRLGSGKRKEQGCSLCRARKQMPCVKGLLLM